MCINWKHQGIAKSKQNNSKLFLGQEKSTTKNLNTVPIRRNLTGNAWQNVFCCRSTGVPIPVLYPIPYISSMSVLSCSVLIPLLFTCSIGKRSQNSFRRTWFPGTRLQEYFQGISDAWLKLLLYEKYKQWTLHFHGENVSPVTWKVQEEDETSRLFFFRNNTKQPVQM